jgi:hypothetical protein
MSDNLIVNSKVREFAKKEDINVSSDFGEGLSKVAEGLIIKAIERVKANGRKTLRGYDL